MTALRRRIPLLGPWLALLLLVGQWLALQHATQHELAASGADSTCQICVFANTVGGLPATLSLLIVAATTIAFLLGFWSFDLPLRRQALPQGRAPPVFLV